MKSPTHKYPLLQWLNLTDENIKGTVLCQMTEQCWFWFVISFTDLGSPFDGTCTCMYAHVFSKHFCSCSKLPRIKFWIFDKLLLLLFQGRDYETDEESEKTNEKEELSSEQWVNV